MNERPKPKTLYKFRSWNNDYHRTLLTDRKLWVPTASDLNDPFDCCIPLRWDCMSVNDQVKRFENMLPDVLSPAEKKQKALEIIKESGIRDDARKAGTMLAWTRIFRETYGVLSFSTVRDVPLLWSHYADAYRGFCVGIDMVGFSRVRREYITRSENPFLGEWVKYVNKVPKIVPSPEKYGDLHGFLESYTTKSVFWDHEREYRFVFLRPPESGLILSPECVSEVVLGSEMPESDKKEVLKTAKAQFPFAQLLQARRKFGSFELEFVPA